MASRTWREHPAGGIFRDDLGPGGEIEPKDLFVRGSRLYHGADELTGYQYMLFRVDTTDSRDDWDALASITEPYAQAVEMLQRLVGQKTRTSRKS